MCLYISRRSCRYYRFGIKWKSFNRKLEICRESHIIYMNLKFTVAYRNWDYIVQEYKNVSPKDWKYEVSEQKSVPVDGLPKSAITQMISGKKVLKMSHTLELFPEAQAALSLPPGQLDSLREGGADYQSAFISTEEEKMLIAAIDRQRWSNDLRRRVQHYGYRYDYKERKATVDDKIGELPEWVSFLCGRLVEQDVFTTHPDQLIVNEYEPGQGIAPHTDRDCFGPVVASVSLCSDCIMDIYRTPKSKKDVFQIVLKRCSLLVLRGVARERWLHGIRSNKADYKDEQKVPRERRFSLTFRTMNHS